MFELASIVPALVGGALIGAAASMLLGLNGRIAGISGIVGGLLSPSQGEVGWRFAFVGGLLVGGLGMALAYPQAFASTLTPTIPVVAAAGLLVGFGTRLGNGCTSGHGVCGLTRFSPRSMVAVATFMFSGAVVATIARLLGGVG